MKWNVCPKDRLFWQDKHGQKEPRSQDKAKGRLVKKTGSLRPQVQAQGKQAKETGSMVDEPQPPREHSDETWEDEPPHFGDHLNVEMEGGNGEELICKFTVIYL